MKNKLKSYSKAGLVACLCISLAILGIALIVVTGFTGDGVLYFAIPSLITLSLISGAFWLKGYKGNDSDKEWVENNW